MDINTINSYIEELEKSDASLSNIRNLAALYTVKEHTQQTVKNDTEEELNDILPQYKKYCSVKKQYQLGVLPQSALCKSMQDLCLEIKEFLLILYRSTESNEERECLLTSLQNIIRTL